LSQPHDHSDHDHGHSHGHSHGPGHAHSHGSNDKTRVLIAACLTGGFMIAEALGGIITGSLALLADAGHMLSDTVSLILAWFAFQLAGRKATSRLTYGFDRIKTLVAYTNGLTIFAIGLWIVYEAAHRVFEPAPILGGPMLLIAFLGLGVNIVAFFVLHGGDRENLNMRGAILHVLGDMLGSVAAIVAAIIILYTGWYPIDPILSALVAVLLFRSAWALVKEAGHMLLEGTPNGVDRDAIARDITTHVDGVASIHHMHIWSLDGARNMATMHACLKDGTDARAAIIDIKLRMATKHRIDHVTVEPEFGACADGRPAAMPLH
jgi:cobalt-zinc-cadmium efflux system protein